MRLVRGRYVDDSSGAVTGVGPVGVSGDVPVELHGGVPVDRRGDLIGGGGHEPAAARSRRRRRIGWAAVLVVTALVSASLGAAWASRPASVDAREAAVVAVVTTLYDALNRGDSTTACRQFSTGARHTGNGVLGRDTSPIAGDALSTYLVDLLAPRDLRASLTGPPAVRFVGDDAIVAAPNRLGYDLPGGDGYAVDGTTTVVLHDYDGTWRIDEHTWVEHGYLGPSGRRSADVGTPRSCPRGSTPNTARAAGSMSPSWLSGMVMDPVAGVLVAATDADRTWRFDVCTNTWTMSRSRVVRDPDVSNLTYDAATGQVVGFSRNGTVGWAYSAATDTWSKLPASGTLDPGIADTSVGYDARGGVLVAVGLTKFPTFGRVWAFDVAADRWDQIVERNDAPDALTGAAPLVYDPGADLFVLMAALDGVTDAWRFDPRGRRWSEGSSGPLLVTAWGWGAMPARATYDAASQRIVASDGTRLALYDAAADRWTTVTKRPAGLAASTHRIMGLADDPVNGRVLVATLPAGVGTSVGVPQLWAYDVLTSVWTPLTR